MVETGRQRGWQAPKERCVPSGGLTFSLYPERYSNRDTKQWKEDARNSLDALFPEIVVEVRRYFVAAQKRREQEAIQSEKQRVASERRWKEYQMKEAIRQEEERKQKHAAALELTERTRSEDLIKAAEGGDCIGCFRSGRRFYGAALPDEEEKRWVNSAEGWALWRCVSGLAVG